MVALVLSHQLVFLHTWGNAYGDALRRSGHSGPWTFTIVTVLLLTGALGEGHVVIEQPSGFSFMSIKEMPVSVCHVIR